MIAVSLRTRLLAGIVVLVGAGLAVSSVVVYAEQRSFLLHRVDGQVSSALIPLAFGLRLLGPGPGARLRASVGPGRSPAARNRLGLARRVGQVLPAGTLGELVAPDGRVLRRRGITLGQSTGSAPVLPTHVPLSSLNGPLHVFSLSARDGTPYRGVALRSGADTALVAVPLRDANATLARLVRIEALVGAAVLGALVLLGWAIIQLGLRPLDRIAAVASEIAAGDLARRVRPDDGRTEVGRLGRSLNRMLSQIEEAFDARRAGEERLRQFIADASHELRTPLAAIRGYSELIALGAAEDPEVRERAIARIGEEAERMGVLVEALLQLAAADQPRARSRESVILGDLVRSAAADAEAIAPDRSISITLDDGAVVIGDAVGLGQLIGNLTRNAIIHTPPGTAIELAARREGEWALITVRDHGGGLPEGAGEQLFERFWRPEGGRRRGAAGSGLGLAIVRAIAHGHAGEVTAANAPDGGALFTVRLPAAPLSAKSQPLHGQLLSG